MTILIINTICAIIQRVFGQNKRRLCLHTSDCSCVRPCLRMSFLYHLAWGESTVIMADW